MRTSPGGSFFFLDLSLNFFMLAAVGSTLNRLPDDDDATTILPSSSLPSSTSTSPMGGVSSSLNFSCSRSRSDDLDLRRMESKLRDLFLRCFSSASLRKSWLTLSIVIVVFCLSMAGRDRDDDLVPPLRERDRALLELLRVSDLALLREGAPSATAPEASACSDACAVSARPPSSASSAGLARSLPTAASASLGVILSAVPPSSGGRSW
mmetsp:Transcript_46867/g.99544  ORF Transcript_46867/g.99544 Transcript_46867/m.99544 type:complete len:209 (-) Transcript_46867:49-675(-)